MARAARNPAPSRRLCLKVLSGWSAVLQPGSELILPGRKVQALLAYLALQGQPQARSKLMTLLWGDHEERLARQSLRRALYLIRRALGPGAGEILAVDDETVLLRPTGVEV